MFVLVIFLTVCVIEIQNRVLIDPYSIRQQFPYEPGCYLNIQHFLSFNESYSPRDGKTCEKYTCDFDGYTYITSCTETFEGDCVKVAGNKTLPYPSCCDYLDCSKRNKTSFSQIAPEPIPDNVTQNTNIEDIGSNPTNETNFTTETSQELSESRNEQSYLNETFDFTNENKSSESFQSQDQSTVSLEINNQDDVNISETTEMSPTESIILPTPSDFINGNRSSNSFPSQDQSTVSLEMNNQDDENISEFTEMSPTESIILPTPSDFINGNRSSNSFPSQDQSTVSLEMNNQDDENISETTEMSPTESIILPKPSDFTSFPSQDLSQISPKMNNDEKFSETTEMTIPDNETLPTATDTLKANEKIVENNENRSVDEIITKSDIQSKRIEENPTENEETE